jgi:hypothetical protein
MEQKPIVYELEFYRPGSRGDVWVYIKSSTPFMALHAGDVVHPGIWPESESPTKALKIDELQHCVWETPDKIRHKIMVFSHEIINQ